MKKRHRFRVPKRFLCAALTAVLICQLFGLPVLALGAPGSNATALSARAGDEFEVDGVSYQVLPGGSDSYTAQVMGWGAAGSQETLTIPEKVSDGEQDYNVVKIDPRSFVGDSTLKKVDLSNATALTLIEGVFTPSSFETAYIGAFAMCDKLSKVIFPRSGRLEIGPGTFSQSGLSGTLTIPQSVTSIGKEAFLYCSKITGLDLSNAGSLSIDAKAFERTGITGKLIISPSVTSVGERAFWACGGVTGLELPATGSLSIGESAFWGTGISGTLTIPKSVTSIGKAAFYGCSGLTGLELPATGSLSIGESAFSSTDIKGMLTIPESVTSIGKDAFSGCTGLTELKLPDSGSLSIGESAFSRTGISGILTIPPGVASIGERAFWACGDITTLNLAAFTGSMGIEAFDGCSKLAAITFGQQTAPTLPANVFRGVAAKGVVYCPAGAAGYDDLVKNSLPADWRASSFTPYAITVTNAAGGSGGASPVISGKDGTVTLTAYPRDSDYIFVRWDANPAVTWVEGTDQESSPAKFKMPAGDVTVTPIFRQETFKITGVVKHVGNPFSTPVTVSLFKDNGELVDEHLKDTIAESGTGAYSFSGLAPGNYKVSVMEFMASGVAYSSEQRKVTVGHADATGTNIDLVARVTFQSAKANGTANLETSTQIAIVFDVPVPLTLNDIALSGSGTAEKVRLVNEGAAKKEWVLEIDNVITPENKGSAMGRVSITLPQGYEHRYMLGSTKGFTLNRRLCAPAITAASYAVDKPVVGGEIAVTPGSYTANEAGAAGAHRYAWYRADTILGTGVQIADTQNYTPTGEDFGKYIWVETTPRGEIEGLWGEAAASRRLQVGIKLTVAVTGAEGGTSPTIDGEAAGSGVVVYGPAVVSFSKTAADDTVRWTASPNEGSFDNAASVTATYTPAAHPSAGNVVLTATLTNASGATVPAAPTGLGAAPGDRQVALTWTAPASDGGSKITGYEVSVNDGAWKSTGGAEPSYTVTGLVNGTAYTFRVRAVNSIGKSEPSAPAIATPADTFEAGGLKYKVLTSGPDNRTASLTGWGAGGARATLAIPAAAQDGCGNTYKVTEIAKGAFDGGTAATTLDISGAVNLVKIHDNAFRDWKNLTAGGLDLSGLTRLTAIGNNAFSGCGFTGGLDLSGLTGLATIGDYPFSGCGFSSVRLPAQMTVIPEGLLAGCKNLTAAALPPDLTTIGTGAFADCGFTGTLDLSGFARLTTIGTSAFSGNAALNEVRFPAGLTSLGDRAFQECASLDRLRFYGMDAPAIGDYVLSAMAADATTGTVYYPAGGTGYSKEDFDSGKGMAQFGRWTFTGVGSATYALTVQAGAGGKVSGSASGEYAKDIAISVTATADPGYRFSHWSVSGIALNTAANPASFKMPAGAVTLTANFTKNTDPGHIHTFDSAWSYDDTCHWHECTAGDGARADEAAHTASEWITDKAATETEAGSRHKECTVCHYEMQRESIAPTGSAYIWRTLTHQATGVKVSGYFTDDAKLEVKDRLLHGQGSCDVCDSIRKRQERGELIALFDISLKSGSYTGDLDVQIPVDSKYNGLPVLLLHCKENVLESRTVTVSGGIAKGTFSSLSPFAAAVQPRGAAAITGLPKDYTLQAGKSVSWTPAPAGGTWSYDRNLLKMTKDGDAYTFKALKTGKATATYTVDGVPFTVTITINSDGSPQTGDAANTLPWLMTMLAALLGCACLLICQKCRCTKRHE